MTKPLLLFVHGLATNAEATWGQFDGLIKKDPDLAARVETAFFSYPTNLFRWWQLWKSLKIQEISRALKTAIDIQHHRHDRILLVCHSLGGLVAKHYVCDALKQTSDLRVRGVIFFATPHSGAALATFASPISWNNRHLKQLRPNSDFIDLLTQDWVNLRCESIVDVTYVAGGEDAVVSRTSAYPAGASAELVPSKGHSTIVRPDSDSDVSYLIVKKVASRLLFDDNGDLHAARTAIAAHDSQSLAALIAHRGRSWIETTHVDAAISVFQDTIASFDARSSEVIWSRYLLALSRLFRHGDTSSTAFSDDLVNDASSIGLDSLFLAERMEFARKRRDRHEALRAAALLLERIEGLNTTTTSASAYSLGTSYFLLGNLYRYGGRYHEAVEAISKARTFYRPTILAHQIELAHCHYASAVCRAMEGSLGSDTTVPLALGAEFRRFADALITLTQSHSAWSMARLGEATDHAQHAAQSFDQISFTEYGRRARALALLLGAWRRLELGAKLDQAVGPTAEYAPIIRGMVGDSTATGALKKWISATRPSQVLGMLQFASAYSSNWAAAIGQFDLPPVLTINHGQLEWSIQESSSLQEADLTLRTLMGIATDVRVPLLAD